MKHRNFNIQEGCTRSDAGTARESQNHSEIFSGLNVNGMTVMLKAA